MRLAVYTIARNLLRPQRSGQLTSVWNSLDFQTLIFTTDEDTYFDLYPDDLVRSIRDHYDLQPGFSHINVFRRRPATALQGGAPSLP